MKGRPTIRNKPSVVRFQRKYKKSELPIDQIKSDYQIKDKSKRRDIAQDKKLEALHSGKRISKNGNVYYEKRENRSDKNKKKRL